MKIELNIPDSLIETVIRGIMDNFPEAANGCALACTAFSYKPLNFTFQDVEDNDKEYKVDKTKLLAAFPLLFTEKWPKGCTKPPFSASEEVWQDWLGQSDATDFDAFIQLVCLGEVVYG